MGVTSYSNKILYNLRFNPYSHVDTYPYYNTVHLWSTACARLRAVQYLIPQSNGQQHSCFVFETQDQLMRRKVCVFPQFSGFKAGRIAFPQCLIY
jgi:hypothetical protein